MGTKLSEADLDLAKRVAARFIAENRKAAEEAARRQVAARAEAARLAAELAEADPSLRGIVLFGSALEGRPFRLDSDIDLAVDGGDYATLLRIAELSSFDVDLVPLDSMSKAFRDLVLTEGVKLYEHDPH